MHNVTCNEIKVKKHVPNDVQTQIECPLKEGHQRPHLRKEQNSQGYETAHN